MTSTFAARLQGFALGSATMIVVLLATERQHEPPAAARRLEAVGPCEPAPAWTVASGKLQGKVHLAQTDATGALKVPAGAPIVLEVSSSEEQRP